MPILQTTPQTYQRSVLLSSVRSKRQRKRIIGKEDRSGEEVDDVLMANLTKSNLAICSSIFLVSQLAESNLCVLPIYANDLQKKPESQIVNKRKLPASLTALLTATTFDDGVRGDGDQSVNFRNYALASDQIQALETSDLQYLLTHASPAGRLYAAVLLKQSGRVGDNECFAKLLGDNATVTYLSGCVGSTYKVKEIADSFIKNGCFNNFKFSQYCKLKASVTADSIAIISDTNILEHFQQGDSNQPSGSWLAFQDLLKAGSGARPQIDQLIKAKASGSRLYGAILLLQIDRTRATNLLKTWQNDNTRVLLSKGCAKEETTVGVISARLLKGEQIVMLKNPN